MTKTLQLGLVGAILASATVTPADDGFFGSLFARSQTPAPELAPMPAPGPAPRTYSYGGPVDPRLTPIPQATPVYPAPGGHYPVAHAPRVKIKDPDHIAPCAVPKVVMVPDPCACNSCCNTCAQVPITICVPPCACEDYKCRKDGRYQKFDYGSYEVEIRVKDGYVEIDYDD